ncbi:MAG: response regulator [Chloroflexota bacterium]
MIAIQKQVLIVDDDPTWSQLLSEILSDSGFSNHIVHNLTDALGLIKNNSHALAIVDLSLSPDDHNNSEGLIVLNALRNLDPACRSILLTGYATVELAVETIKEFGAFSFLRKENFNRVNFQSIVYKALAYTPPQYLKENKSENTIEIHLSENDPSEITPNSNISILVVDDDAGWRSIIEEILIDYKYHVQVCNGFGEALSYLRRETYSLAIIDLFLTNEIDIFWEKSTQPSELEGFELLKTISDMGIPSIIVSGVSSVESVQKAYTNEKVFAFLEKQSFTRNSFIRIVQDALKKIVKNDEFSILTDREKEVFQLLYKGLTNKEISSRLFISTNTTKRHLKAIFEKLNVHTRSAAVAKFPGAGK